VSPADLIVRRDLVIPGAELRESASRAGGPGGQNVDKTSTRVTLRWCVTESAALTATQRARLLRRLASRLTRRGELIVHARRFRSRPRNRQLARERIGELVREALAVRRPRVATRASRAARARTLAEKRRRAAVKRQRGRVDRSRDDS
jgi:ribosome-associated protein